jgi:hypothetical protein
MYVSIFGVFGTMASKFRRTSRRQASQLPRWCDIPAACASKSTPLFLILIPRLPRYGESKGNASEFIARVGDLGAAGPPHSLDSLIEAAAYEFAALS